MRWELLQCVGSYRSALVTIAVRRQLLECVSTIAVRWELWHCESVHIRRGWYRDEDRHFSPRPIQELRFQIEKHAFSVVDGM